MTKLKHSKGSSLQRTLDSSAVKLFGVVATVIGLVHHWSVASSADSRKRAETLTRGECVLESP